MFGESLRVFVGGSCHIDWETFSSGNGAVGLITKNKTWIPFTANLSASCRLPIHPPARRCACVLKSLPEYSSCVHACVVPLISLSPPTVCVGVCLCACVCLLSGSISQKSRGSCQRWLPWFPQREGYAGDETSLTVLEGKKKKKPWQNTLEDLKSTTKIQEVSLLFMTASLYSCTGYTLLLHHLWRGEINARVPPPSKLSSARQFVYRAPAWPLPVIWCTLHILHAASLGFSKWISEAWAATFLALCTRCTLSWAAESPNTCWAWPRPFRWHQEPAERRGKATLERVAVDSKIN